MQLQRPPASAAQVFAHRSQSIALQALFDCFGIALANLEFLSIAGSEHSRTACQLDHEAPAGCPDGGHLLQEGIDAGVGKSSRFAGLGDLAVRCG